MARRGFGCGCRRGVRFLLKKGLDGDARRARFRTLGKRYLFGGRGIGISSGADPKVNYLIKGKDLRFALEGKTYHFNSGDIWLVNRRKIHSSSGKEENWEYESLIIDDDFLLSQYPTSINWNLDLLGKNGTENKTAYKKLEKEIIELGKLCHKPLTDARRFMVLSHLSFT